MASSKYTYEKITKKVIATLRERLETEEGFARNPHLYAIKPDTHIMHIGAHETESVLEHDERVVKIDAALSQIVKDIDCGNLAVPIPLTLTSLVRTIAEDLQTQGRFEGRLPSKSTAARTAG